jgi:hypothetical protein
MAHLVPSHRSARVCQAPELVTEYPTAAHQDEEVHATAIGIACGEPAGLGMGSRRHLAPSHCSASGRTAPELVTECPTAVQADDVVQATPYSALTFAPAGFGVGWMAHLVPFHRSASVTPTPEART